MPIKPEQLLDFVETGAFAARWDSLGLDDEDDLAALQIQIMRDPKRAPVIRGTDGIRKVRFVPPRWRTGKRGLRGCCMSFWRNSASSF